MLAEMVERAMRNRERVPEPPPAKNEQNIDEVKSLSISPAIKQAILGMSPGDRNAVLEASKAAPVDDESTMDYSVGDLYSQSAPNSRHMTPDHVLDEETHEAIDEETDGTDHDHKSIHDLVHQDHKQLSFLEHITRTAKFKFLFPYEVYEPEDVKQHASVRNVEKEFRAAIPEMLDTEGRPLPNQDHRERTPMEERKEEPGKTPFWQDTYGHELDERGFRSAHHDAIEQPGDRGLVGVVVCVDIAAIVAGERVARVGEGRNDRGHTHRWGGVGDREGLDVDVAQGFAVVWGDRATGDHSPAKLGIEDGIAAGFRAVDRPGVGRLIVIAV